MSETLSFDKARYLQGMSKVHIVVTTKTAKVSDKTLSRSHAVVVEGPALPFGKGEGYLKFDVLKVTRSKGSRAFNTIEVVVEARALRDKERARNTLEVDVGLELVFKGLLDEDERFFLVQQVLERGLVVLQDVLGRESSKGIFRVESSSHGRSFLDVWRTRKSVSRYYERRPSKMLDDERFLGIGCRFAFVVSLTGVRISNFFEKIFTFTEIFGYCRAKV